MKKVISILLCALLLVSSLAISVSAEDTSTLPTIIYGDSDDELEYRLPDDEVWESGKQYLIKAGSTFVIPSGRTLNVPENATLVVEENAHLVINGQLHVSSTATVLIQGKITGSNIVGMGTDPEYRKVKCEVRFPDLEDAALASKIFVYYYMSDSSEDYGDINVELDEYTLVPSDGATVEVPYNTYLYVRVVIREAPGEDRYDDKLYPVYCNSVRIAFAQNACPILVTTAGDISYGAWKGDTTYYNTYTITLPEGEGYTVYGRNSEIGEVVLKYGQSFSFRVELEEEYNQSAYEVYVFNGNGWTSLEKDELLTGIKPAVPDAEGYYTINSITGDYSIFVEGVISNQMLDIFSKVFNIFRQIWEAISEIFAELFGEGGLGNLFG